MTVFTIALACYGLTDGVGDGTGDGSGTGEGLGLAMLPLPLPPPLPLPLPPALPPSLGGLVSISPEVAVPCSPPSGVVKNEINLPVLDVI